MRVNHTIILAFFLLSGIPIGCATTSPSPTSPPAHKETDIYVANFKYAPTAQETPNSAGVTFTVGNIIYEHHSETDVVAWYNKTSQLANLPDAMKQDLSTLLAAKGFSVRGPFDSYDLIPFQDKKAIDLRLIPTLELSVAGKDMKHGYANFMLTSYLDTGKVEVTGNITLALKEIVTLELLWAKTIPIKKFEYSYALRYPINSPIPMFDAVMNDLAKGLETQYPELMDTISKLIDPEEMRILKEQAQELKAKKGY